MPAVSKSQQSLMGMVHAYKKGELKKPSGKVKKVASHISDKDAKDFAKTKRKGLPKKVKKESFEERLDRALFEESIDDSDLINISKVGIELRVS